MPEQQPAAVLLDTCAAIGLINGERMAPQAAAASHLPGQPPAGGARAFGFAIVTRNRELTPYGRAGHLTAIAC
jgi:hypothetical protein